MRNPLRAVWILSLIKYFCYKREARHPIFTCTKRNSLGGGSHDDISYSAFTALIMKFRQLLPLACAGMMAAAVSAKENNDTISFSKLGTYSAGIFSSEVSAAEIVAHDRKSQRLFVVNGAQNRIDVLNFSNPAAPTLLFFIDCLPFGSQPNSAAVHNGVVAVAIQAAVKTDPGTVAFFDADGVYLASVKAGALPDMICFTPNGQYVLVANEGEPSADYTIDPEGSISVINMPGNVAKLTQADVRTANFRAFNGTTLDSSVRIFGPGATIAQDLEPEYITISSDSKRALVTLQENNAVAFLDIKEARVTGIKGLGFKDHAAIDPVTETYTFDQAGMPAIGTTIGGQTIKLGGFSGLAFEGINPVNGRYKFITHTDRGPNGEPTGINRPFLLPNFAPEIVRFELDRTSGNLALTQRIQLQRAPGLALTGLPNLTLGTNANLPYNDEIGVNLLGVPTGADPFGADLEGIVVDPVDGSFWMCDEYRPAIYHFTPVGMLIERFVPVGTAAKAGMPAGTYGTEVLPAILANRRQNRGFEAIAWDNGKIYAWVQSPLRNPELTSNGVLNALRNVRVMELNPATKAVRQFIYVMDNPNPVSVDDTRADKIGDAVGLGGGEFLVLERDDDSITSIPADPVATITKKVYRLNLAGATPLTPSLETTLLASTGKTPDQATLPELTGNGIQPIGKMLHVDLATAGFNQVQKVEGIAVVDQWTIAVINDNDFQVAGISINNTTGTFALLPGYAPEPTTLGIIDVKLNGLDASDREISSSQGRINIRQWPVKGMYQPDGIATFRVQNNDYFITANEGDARAWGSFDEEKRVNAVKLDPTAFPYGNTLKNNAQLGRLTITTTRGDTDGDGDYDELYVFGGRSFSILNEKGEMIFDSGDTIERLIANHPKFAAIFNSSHTTNTLDDRSDNKGPEPESIAVGEIAARPHAFVGLERIGGFMVFDVSEPTSPRFIDYINHRNPTTTPGLNNGSDYGPEGLIFIAANDSPIKVPLVVVANEVSGTTTAFRIDIQKAKN